MPVIWSDWMSLKYKDNLFFCMVGNLWVEYDIYSGLKTEITGRSVLVRCLAQNSPIGKRQ